MRRCGCRMPPMTICMAGPAPETCMRQQVERAQLSSSWNGALLLGLATAAKDMGPPCRQGGKACHTEKTSSGRHNSTITSSIQQHEFRSHQLPCYVLLQHTICSMIQAVPAAAAPVGCAPPSEWQPDARLDAALCAALAAPPPPPSTTRPGLSLASLSMLQELEAALAAAPETVPGPELRTQLQAALESDQAWQRARAVELLKYLPRAVVAQVGPDSGEGAAHVMT